MSAWQKNETVWNPWHGCTKISPGCRHCYVYRLDKSHNSEILSSECRRTANFTLPVKRNRDGSYKVAPGSLVYTCFTSDFFLKDADGWRWEAWDIIRERRDCDFFFFTKRIDRFPECIPDDWGDGYDNVIIGCTVENQVMADFRLPIFLSSPIKHRVVGVEPMLEKINLSEYLDGRIESVSLGGESGPEARVCDFDWVLNLRSQCIEKSTAFHYHQTGAKLVKDGKIYYIPRELQQNQAARAGLDWKP